MYTYKYIGAKVINALGISFRKFVHITYQLSGNPNFRSYVIFMPILNIQVSKLYTIII